MALHFRVSQSLCLSAWRNLSLWLRVSLSARRYTYTWLKVSLVPYGIAYQHDSRSILYPMALRINMTQGLSCTLWHCISFDSGSLLYTMALRVNVTQGLSGFFVFSQWRLSLENSSDTLQGDRTVTGAPPAGIERHRGKAELQTCLAVRFRYLSANGRRHNWMFRLVLFFCRLLKGRTSWVHTGADYSHVRDLKLFDFVVFNNTAFVMSIYWAKMKAP